MGGRVGTDIKVRGLSGSTGTVRKDNPTVKHGWEGGTFIHPGMWGDHMFHIMHNHV